MSTDHEEERTPSDREAAGPRPQPTSAPKDETAAAASPDGDTADGETEDVLELDDAELELQMVRAERDEYLDALRRLQAEFDNYRKRVQRQQTELSTRATESLIEALLPVLDAFDLALGHAREAAREDELTGVLGQIAELLRSTLAREGLERIDVSGAKFDPEVHDAVAHDEREEGDESSGVVVEQVLRAGYRLHGRVLRPAMVKVRG